MRTVSLLLILLLIVPLLTAQSKANDDRIYNEVREKLAADTDVGGAAVEVEVKNGAVILRGRVHTTKVKEKAERITKKVKGVVSVNNQLTLITD